MVGQGEVTSMGPGLAFCIDVGGSMSAGGGVGDWELSLGVSRVPICHFLLGFSISSWLPFLVLLFLLPFLSLAYVSLSLSKHQGPNLGSNLGVSCQYQMSRVWGDLVVFLCHLVRKGMCTPLNVLK